MVPQYEEGRKGSKGPEIQKGQKCPKGQKGQRRAKLAAHAICGNRQPKYEAVGIPRFEILVFIPCAAIILRTSGRKSE